MPLKRSLYAGIAAAQPGGRLGDVAAAIQKTVEAAGFWVVREFVGHGIGSSFHESPDVPNYGRAGTAGAAPAGFSFGYRTDGNRNENRDQDFGRRLDRADGE